MKSFATILSVALAFASTSAALPTAEVEAVAVIPGPGLPSLEELGLTSADLYNKRSDFFETGMSRRPAYNSKPLYSLVHL